MSVRPVGCCRSAASAEGRDSDGRRRSGNAGRRKRNGAPGGGSRGHRSDWPENRAAGNGNGDSTRFCGGSLYALRGGSWPQGSRDGDGRKDANGNPPSTAAACGSDGPNEKGNGNGSGNEVDLRPTLQKNMPAGHDHADRDGAHDQSRTGVQTS